MKAYKQYAKQHFLTFYYSTIRQNILPIAAVSSALDRFIIFCDIKLQVLNKFVTF